MSIVASHFQVTRLPHTALYCTIVFQQRINRKNMYLKPIGLVFNVFCLYSPPEHTKYQTNMALHHVILYEYNVDLN